MWCVFRLLACVCKFNEEELRGYIQTTRRGASLFLLVGLVDLLLEFVDDLLALEFLGCGHVALLFC